LALYLSCVDDGLEAGATEAVDGEAGGGYADACTEACMTRDVCSVLGRLDYGYECCYMIEDGQRETGMETEGEREDGGEREEVRRDGERWPDMIDGKEMMVRQKRERDDHQRAKTKGRTLSRTI
jgi:hypothetical protein